MGFGACSWPRLRKNHFAKTSLKTLKVMRGSEYEAGALGEMSELFSEVKPLTAHYNAALSACVPTRILAFTWL